MPPALGEGEGLLESEDAGVGETRRPLSEAPPAGGLGVVAVTVTSLCAGSLLLPAFLFGSRRAGIDGNDGSELNEDNAENEDIELLEPNQSKARRLSRDGAEAPPFSGVEDEGGEEAEGGAFPLARSVVLFPPVNVGLLESRTDCLSGLVSPPALGATVGRPFPSEGELWFPFVALLLFVAVDSVADMGISV